jgi:hypothetical protein
MIALAMITGALTSAAWLAPKPYCYYFVAGATVLFVVIKGAN